MAINSTINKLFVFAKQSKRKSEQLAAEERKALGILCQMIPKPIANEPRVGKDVQPTYFNSAAICYVDIVGFVALISSLKPSEVTKQLNEVYG